VSRSTTSRIRLGILTNEILDPAVSRTGGFGFAARSVAALFAAEPDLGVDPVVIVCEQLNTGHARRYQMDGEVDVLLRSDDVVAWVDSVRREAIDILLCIDYRDSYRSVLDGLSSTPVIIWVRDPRTWEDYGRIAGLRAPGRDDAPAPGLGPGPVRGLSRVLLRSLARNRKFVLCPTMADLRRKIWRCYGVPPWRSTVLPNIIEPPSREIVKDPRPLVLFLGRLDPYKRPWIAVEIARRMPDVSFVFLGTNHFPEYWSLDSPPPNVTLEGHLQDENKRAWLERAWLLLNTSIHEGLPVSFLEALAFEVPLVSCHDPASLATSFGRYIHRSLGDGMDSVDLYVTAIRELIDDPAARHRLGEGGRAWTAGNHSRQTFLRTFSGLCGRLGVPGAPEFRERVRS
jgi:glycosyltransferase involved in cell wall biosynthesis